MLVEAAKYVQMRIETVVSCPLPHCSCPSAYNVKLCAYRRTSLCTWYIPLIFYFVPLVLLPSDNMCVCFRAS